jgi:uncharacterized protein YozE (UPF0346 family)
LKSAHNSKSVDSRKNSLNFRVTSGHACCIAAEAPQRKQCQVFIPSRFGDLADDVLRDTGFPRAAKHYQEALAYLNQHGACTGALDVLAEAWTERRIAALQTAPQNRSDSLRN